MHVITGSIRQMGGASVKKKGVIFTLEDAKRYGVIEALIEGKMSNGEAAAASLLVIFPSMRASITPYRFASSMVNITPFFFTEAPPICLMLPVILCMG